MRLDKFLKVTRIIKRRTVAKELADNGNIAVNGEQKKSSYDVKKGDSFILTTACSSYTLEGNMFLIGSYDR